MIPRAVSPRAALLLLLLAFPAQLTAATVYVAQGDNLQAALNAALPGDTVLIEPGAVFRGKYTLPVKSNPGGLYITVRSAAADHLLPAPGTRMTPAYAEYLPKIRSSDTLAALTVPPGASYWRVELLEFHANVSGSSDIIRVGTHLETDPAAQPHHIVFDRVYVRGDPEIGQRNGIVAHASHFELRNSYIADIKLVGTETHAFLSYNGAGPYVIENNYLEASGINVMFGGADPRNASMIPSNITVRHNHVAKNREWMLPRADGKYWTVKNLFELKVGRQVVVESNLFEYNWSGSSDQAGFAVLLRTENQGGSCDWCETGDVLFQYNIVRHAPAGLSLNGLDYPSGGTPRGVRMHDVTIRHNLFADMDRDKWLVRDVKGAVMFAIINGVDRLNIDHNTIVMVSGTSVVYFNGSYKSPDFMYTNNMSEHRLYGMKGDATAIGTATLEAFTVNYVVTANVLAGGKASSYPTGNHFPTVADWKGQFVDFSGGDYRLAEGSPYRRAGTDGADLGADIAAIHERLAASPPPPPPPPPPPVNNPPVAHSQSVTTDEGVAVAIVLDASDPDGDTLTYSVGAPGSGALSGTAPVLSYMPQAGFAGTDSFTYAVSDGQLTDSATVTITVVAQLAVTTSTLPDANVRKAYSATLQASGGVMPYTWSIVAGALPPGLTLDASTGKISGQPVTGGTYAFTVQVRDGAGRTASRALSIKVAGPPR